MTKICNYPCPIYDLTEFDTIYMAVVVGAVALNIIYKGLFAASLIEKNF